MENFLILLFLMSVLIVCSALATKIDFPSPVMLMIAGLLIGFIPSLPDVELNPEIVFIIILPPLLFDAATKTAWFEFKAAIRPISTLAITLVFFTTIAVAIAAHYLVPGFGWPVAFVLGAIVSPPDAVATTSITKGLRLNKRIVTILEGESLVNDASALIAYRYAVAAVTTGSFVFWKAGLQFLLVACGGIAIGLAIGWMITLIYKKTNNALVETTLLLLMPFLIYMLAEHVHTSGVLAVVSAGLLFSWQSPEIISFQTRVQNKSVWDTLIFLLNGFVFLLIGLQYPAILKGLTAYSIWQLVGYGFLISAVTIIIRILWVFAGVYYAGLNRWRNKHIAAATDTVATDLWKHVLIVAWTGTRGIVSLATALALPLSLQNGSLFPQRNLILFLAFTVIFITLIVQGMSLPLLIKLLRVKKEAAPEQEYKELQLFMADSVLQFIDHDFPIPLEEEVAAQMRRRYETIEKVLVKEILHSRKNKAANTNTSIPISPLLEAQIEIAKFQRQLLVQLHKEGAYSDDAIRFVENNLDIEEMRLETLLPAKQQDD